ncbi:MAG: FdtA/QdtA family cupin domain-containing protein [Sediminibacterium sp.]
MSKIIDLRTFSDDRGYLTVIEKNLPFEIKRVFYIYNVDDSKRGFHRHKKTIQAAVCVKGSCNIMLQSGTDKSVETFTLNTPSKCLILSPEDFHWMQDFSEDAVLVVLASEYYDKDDYIFENY